MDIKLKQANVLDLDVVKGMAKTFFDSTPYVNFPMDENFLNSYIENYLISPHKEIVIAYDGETPVGFIAFELGAWNFTSLKACIERALWVNPEYRKSEVAKNLLGAMEFWGDLMECKIYQLSSLEGEYQKMLDKFYTKMNYTKVESIYLKSFANLKVQ